MRSLAVTAGASAPEVLVEEVIRALKERYDVTLETVTTADEDMFFPCRGQSEIGIGNARKQPSDLA